MPLSTAQLDGASAFVASLNDASSTAALFDLTRAYVGALGFPHFIYLRDTHPDGSWAGLHFNNYPVAFAERYDEEHYRPNDLVVRGLATRVTPFTWAGIRSDVDESAAERQVFGEAAEAGLRSGVAVPLHGPGGARARLVVCGDLPAAEGEALFAETRHLLMLAATYLHERALAVTADALPLPVSLTRREGEVLLWSARGKTSWEIGEILAVSEHTIKEHLRTAARKLGAENKTQACALALWRGLIHL